jgi:hypothetical protein
MKIKMLWDVSGAFHVDAGTGKGWTSGVKAGEIVDIEEWHAKRYIAAGMAKPA